MMKISSIIIEGLNRAEKHFPICNYYEACSKTMISTCYMLRTRHCVLCEVFYCELYFIDDLLIGIAINKELMTPYGQHGVYNALFCGLKTVRDYRDRRKVNA